MDSVKQTIGDVRRMIDAGASITTAIKEALAQNGLETVTAFAEKYDLNRSTAGTHLSGIVRADAKTVEALATELSGTPAEFAELLWLAGKPVNVAKLA